MNLLDFNWNCMVDHQVFFFKHSPVNLGIFPLFQPSGWSPLVSDDLLQSLENAIRQCLHEFLDKLLSSFSNWFIRRHFKTKLTSHVLFDLAFQNEVSFLARDDVSLNEAMIPEFISNEGQSILLEVLTHEVVSCILPLSLHQPNLIKELQKGI